MYDRILLPTDGSAGMTRVIEHAGELAAAHGATIYSLYVVDATSYTSLPMETSWDGVSGLLEEEGNEALAEVERVVDDSVPVECETAEGSPGREIVSHAHDYGCDLVVMGTHGRGGIDRLLLGSVAEQVIRAADVPVLTVHVTPETTGVDPAIDATGERTEDDQEVPPDPGVR